MSLTLTGRRLENSVGYGHYKAGNKAIKSAIPVLR